MTVEEIYIELTNIRDDMNRKNAHTGLGQIEDLINKIESDDESAEFNHEFEKWMMGRFEEPEWDEGYTRYNLEEAFKAGLRNEH